MDEVDRLLALARGFQINIEIGRKQNVVQGQNIKSGHVRDAQPEKCGLLTYAAPRDIDLVRAAKQEAKCRENLGARRLGDLPRQVRRLGYGVGVTTTLAASEIQSTSRS